VKEQKCLTQNEEVILFIASLASREEMKNDKGGRTGTALRTSALSAGNKMKLFS